MSHFLLMCAYALQISIFFAVLWRRDRPGQIRLFLQLFLSLIGGGLLLGWIMFPFPSAPPAPFP